MTPTEDDIKRAMRMAEEDASMRKEQADSAGEEGDRGAGQTREFLRIYQAGLRGEVPTFLAPFVKKAQLLGDPEYLQFLTLRRKFGDLP